MVSPWVEYDGGAVQEWHRSALRIRVDSDVTVIPEGAFEDCEDLTAVDLNDVTKISGYAFAGCGSLERVIWPTASAVEIGRQAFQHCANLSEIDLRNVTKIGRGALSHCHALTRVTIPSSVAEVEDGAFYNCSELLEVELCEGIQRIGERVFCECRALVRASIPKTVTDIDTRAFHNCSSLADVVLNEGLKHIGWNVFFNCASLQSISVPSTTVEVGKGAFQNCTSLTEFTLREGVNCIDLAAFYGCRSLTHKSIRIPPVALVIDIRGGSCHLLRTSAMRLPARPEKKLIASWWMQYRSPRQIEQAEAKVNEILDRQHQTDEEKVDSIREWFAYYFLLDVTTLLELAVWRVNVNGNEQSAEARKESRRSCGSDMNVIIPSVLPFLEG